MGKYVENGINIDPKPLTVEEFSIAGNIDGKVSVSKEHINMMTKGAPVYVLHIPVPHGWIHILWMGLHLHAVHIILSSSYNFLNLFLL